MTSVLKKLFIALIFLNKLNSMHFLKPIAKGLGSGTFLSSGALIVDVVAEKAGYSIFSWNCYKAQDITAETSAFLAASHALTMQAPIPMPIKCAIAVGSAGFNWNFWHLIWNYYRAIR